MSQSLNAAAITSRDAAFIKFDLLADDLMSGNSQPYGSLTISQKAKGYDVPNVQSAIDDVYASFVAPINTIIINTDGISPNAVQQEDTYKFTGDAKETAKIKVFGYDVQVTKGDTKEQVVTKTLSVLRDALARRECFTEVKNVPTDGSIIDVKYIDTQKHKLDSYVTNGIKIEQIIRNGSKPGYGVWNQIGTEQKTLVGGSAITLYYFKRFG